MKYKSFTIPLYIFIIDYSLVIFRSIGYYLYIIRKMRNLYYFMNDTGNGMNSLERRSNDVYTDIIHIWCGKSRNHDCSPFSSFKIFIQ